MHTSDSLVSKTLETPRDMPITYQTFALPQCIGFQLEARNLNQGIRHRRLPIWPEPVGSTSINSPYLEYQTTNHKFHSDFKTFQQSERFPPKPVRDERNGGMANHSNEKQTQYGEKRNTLWAEHALKINHDDRHLTDAHTIEITQSVLDMVLSGTFQYERTVRQDSSERMCSGEAGWPVEVRPACTDDGRRVTGVVAATHIPAGAQLGPLTYTRDIYTTSPKFVHRNEFMWEVCSVKGEVSHYVEPSNWMAYVGTALTDAVQNLAVEQRGTSLYYRTLVDINKDEELMVWYSPEVPSFFGITLSSESYLSTMLSGKNARDASSGRGRLARGAQLRCTVCRRAFNSRSNLRSHMRTHTLQRPFTCTHCGRGFSQSSTLRNHVRLHTGEKPYKCVVCQSSYSQLAGLRAHQKSSRHRPKH